MTRPLTHAERIAWVRLARTAGVGPITFQRLRAAFGAPASALQALRRKPWPSLGEPPDEQEITAELKALEALGGAWVCLGEPDYPMHLTALTAPPPFLALRGAIPLAHRPAVALVGGREASAIALRFAADLAHDLSALGYVVVSGLARGVDAAAHEASLPGGTIAVLAGGVDQPYPPQNVALYEMLCREGLVLSDARLGLVARARDFPRRNTLIAGLAQAVVVVEAALQSGSLITARAAADMGRDVMAVPGSPLDPRARGANALIKDGATLVESAADVHAALQGAPRGLHASEPSEPADWPESQGREGPDKARVAALLSPTPAHVNTIARAAGLSPQAAGALVLELEMQGAALSHPGGFVSSAAGVIASEER